MENLNNETVSINSPQGKTYCFLIEHQKEIDEIILNLSHCLDVDMYDSKMKYVQGIAELASNKCLNIL